jgi:hypothetical protein
LASLPSPVVAPLTGRRPYNDERVPVHSVDAAGFRDECGNLIFRNLGSEQEFKRHGMFGGTAALVRGRRLRQEQEQIPSITSLLRLSVAVQARKGSRRRTLQASGSAPNRRNSANASWRNWRSLA